MKPEALSRPSAALPWPSVLVFNVSQRCFTLFAADKAQYSEVISQLQLNCVVTDNT